ncbi:MAG: TonB-dependent receptor plug domain-containing protein [Bacteroidales bacterium]|nr:TonB-dependent receptor plug domain-containing protein [Bacteroidales bacterium]
MALFGAVAWAAAQTQEVKGTVLDQEGDPITGAAVAITGTEMRVVTDIDGRFSLPKVDSSHKTVTVTFVGMETVTQKITPDMVIVMHSQSQIMDEVVVVAFGKQKREAFTGSAAVVKSDDIVKRQANNPISALEGKVPGLTMLQSNDPTSENTINIRGLSSINASTTPLIILDGQPYNGSWRDINPADVDNISVLKDAASNALYGARGANGVIMITTKSATKGKTKVTLDMKWGVNTDALRDYDVIDDPAEYYEAHYLALRNYYTRSLGYSASKAHLAANDAMTGTSIDAGGLGYILYSVPQGETLIGSNGKLNPNATLGNRVYNNGQIYTLYPDSWKDAGLRNGFRQEYNLSISGGADKYSTYSRSATSTMRVSATALT